MKKFTAAFAAALLVGSSFAAQAGGLNEAVEEVVPEKTARSGMIIPLLLLIAVGIAASSTSSNEDF